MYVFFLLKNNIVPMVDPVAASWLPMADLSSSLALVRDPVSWKRGPSGSLCHPTAYSTPPSVSLAADPAAQQQKLRLSPQVCVAALLLSSGPHLPPASEGLCRLQRAQLPKFLSTMKLLGPTEEVQEKRTSPSPLLDAPGHSGVLMSRAGCPFYTTFYTSTS